MLQNCFVAVFLLSPFLDFGADGKFSHGPVYILSLAFFLLFCLKFFICTEKKNPKELS